METVLIQAQPIVNWTLVEVPIASDSTRVAIQDQPMLRNADGKKVVIKSIETITAKTLVAGVLNSGSTTPRVDIIKSTLVLYSSQWEKVQYMPLARLISMHDMDATTATTIPFNNDPVTFENLADVDWTKSYIQFANGQKAAGASVLILGIQYQVFDSSGREIKP